MFFASCCYDSEGLGVQRRLFLYTVYILAACYCSTLKRSSSSSFFFLTSHFLLHAPWAWSRRRRQKEEGYFSAGLAIISAYSASSRSPLFLAGPPFSLSDELRILRWLWRGTQRICVVGGNSSGGPLAFSSFLSTIQGK